MKRILIVATSEFLTLVRSKFFIIGILMMPVLIGASVAFQVFAAKRVDVDDHTLAVIDRTGVLYAPLAAAAEAHDREAGDGPTRVGPHFLLSAADGSGGSADEVRLGLSERVRKKALFAFVEIPASVLDMNAPPEPISYFTESPSYTALPQWLESTLNREITARKFAQASVDPALIAKLTRNSRVSTLSLVERNNDGTVRQATKVDELQTFAMPFALMYLLFIAVMTSAPQLLNAVIEEKMSRISEVLVASVTPFQLMMGKLVGTVAVSVLLATAYVVGGIYAALQAARPDLIQPPLIGWFFVFLLCAVLIYGSIFLSIGAASSDIKDAQGMMQTAMLLVMLPIFMAPVILRAPESNLAIGASLFPTATPFLMLIRLAIPPGPPLWQTALSVVLTLVTACAFVYAAGRIFRVGLLMQGKGATFAEMIRWIRA